MLFFYMKNNIFKKQSALKLKKDQLISIAFYYS